MKRLFTRASVGAVIVAAALAGGLQSAQADVSPQTVDITLQPGGSTTVEKTVTTPTVPPKPDIVFLADTTGSMGAAINNVKTNASNVMSTVLSAQPDSQFGVAEYKDLEHGPCLDPYDVRVNAPVTPSTVDAQAGITLWSASGGCDIPENALLALHHLATDPAIAFRSGSTRIIVWFGDAPSHDDGSPSLAQTITALQAANIKVIAVSTGADQLDATGQASAIASATGGVFLSGVVDTQVSNAILTGLQNLPVKVTPVATCSTGLTVSFSPTEASGTSGDTFTFTETLALSASATVGTYTCTVDFQLNGQPAGPGFVQTVTVKYKDKVAPTATCTEGPNPSGNVPKAGQNPKSGQNPDGFWTVSGSDNLPGVTVYVKDGTSGYVYPGPFNPSGTNVKYTQAPGATPSQEPGEGVVTYKLKGQGDMVIYAVDAAGNKSAETKCLVPPPPK